MNQKFCQYAKKTLSRQAVIVVKILLKICQAVNNQNNKSHRIDD